MNDNHDFPDILENNLLLSSQNTGYLEITGAIVQNLEWAKVTNHVLYKVQNLSIGSVSNCYD